MYNTFHLIIQTQLSCYPQSVGLGQASHINVTNYRYPWHLGYLHVSFAIGPNATKLPSTYCSSGTE